MRSSSHAGITLFIMSTATVSLLALTVMTGEWFCLIALPAALMGFGATHRNTQDQNHPDRVSNAWCGGVVWAFTALMIAAIVRVLAG